MRKQPEKHTLTEHRLHTHHLLDPGFPDPAAAVAHFGAVQAQDMYGSLLALGLRVAWATEASVEVAVAEGSIVKTWPLRGTIHFVAPEDVRWMLGLSAARTVRGMAGRLRQLELGDADFARAGEALVAALAGGRRLERHAAYAVVDAAGVSTEGQRGIHVLQRLALDGLLCFGPREGKQPTFILLDEWVPAGRELPRDAALAELARRYFTSHGPATLADYTWWSGLTAAEARAGLEEVKGELERWEVEGQSYWLKPAGSLPALQGAVGHLLPVYDEYTVAYRDRSAILAAEFAERPDAGNGIFRAPILIDGHIVGTCTRALKKGQVVVMPNLFRPLATAERAALAAAVERYGAFLELKGMLGLSS